LQIFNGNIQVLRFKANISAILTTNQLIKGLIKAMLVSSPFGNLMQEKEELGETSVILHCVCVSIISFHIKAQYSNKKQQILHVLEGLSKVNNAYRQAFKITVDILFTLHIQE